MNTTRTMAVMDQSGNLIGHVVRHAITWPNGRTIEPPEPDDIPATGYLDDYVCPACGGLITPLGILGSLEHFRCRGCGAEMSRGAAEERAVGKPKTVGGGQ